jgi:hypothetical protein
METNAYLIRPTLRVGWSDLFPEGFYFMASASFMSVQIYMILSL